MIPRILNEWSIEIITDILITKRYETEYFDFKERLPDSRNPKDKERLQKTCCAFANSDGGFILFGVLDDKSKTVDERLVGFDPTVDFPEHFGNYPCSCSPSIDWTFRNPPLMLSNNNVLHIVHIPKSWNTPHAVGDHEKGFHFTKRTNKGNEGMNFEEIRSAYLGYYEKRLKLQLLRAELATLKEDAQDGFISDPTQIDKTFIPITFDTSVIESIITDTYTIIANNIKLLQYVKKIRQKTRITNNKLHMFFSVVHLPMTNWADRVKGHNTWMREECNNIETLCEQAINELDSLLK